MADPDQNDPQGQTPNPAPAAGQSGRPQTGPQTGQVTTPPASPVHGRSASSALSALPPPTHEEIINQLRLTAQNLRAGNWTQAAKDAFTLGLMVFGHFTGTQQAFPRHVMLAQGGGPGTITAAQCAAELDRLAGDLEQQSGNRPQGQAALQGLSVNWQQLIMAVVQAVLSSLRQA